MHWVNQAKILCKFTILPGIDVTYMNRQAEVMMWTVLLRDHYTWMTAWQT